MHSSNLEKKKRTYREGRCKKNVYGNNRNFKNKIAGNSNEDCFAINRHRIDQENKSITAEGNPSSFGWIRENEECIEKILGERDLAD